MKNGVSASGVSPNLPDRRGLIPVIRVGVIILLVAGIITTLLGKPHSLVSSHESLCIHQPAGRTQ